MESLNNFPIELKFFIYCPDVQDQDILKVINKLLKFSTLTYYGYFLQNNPGNLTLLTINFFSKNHCKEPRLETVDVLNKTSLIWRNQLKIEKKYSNFNGCLLIFGYPIEYEGLDYRIVDGKGFGFYFDLYRILGRKGNFVTFHQPVFYSGERSPIPEKFPNFNYSFYPDVMLLTGAYGNPDYYHLTSTFDEIEEGFSITPSEAYNSYEKLILPFDELTWTFLIITFACAFFFIFVINFTPRFIQNLVYGDNVTSPAFNVVAIFFGIGQTRLPSENFSRIILMVFIFFCLVIRTAYQGVLFDFMTKDMRKPIPKTIADLKKAGYVINYADIGHIRFSLFNAMSKSERSMLRPINPFEYTKIYCDQINNDTAKMAFYCPKDSFDHFKYALNCSGIFMEERWMKRSLGIAMERNHFLYQLTNNVLQNIISTGIPQNLRKFYEFFIFKIVPEVEENEPQVLALKDLSFGFNIWLIAISASIIAFVLENIHFRLVKFIRKCVKQFIGNVAVLINLMMWLKRYRC